MSDEHSHIEASPLLQNQNHGNSTSPSHKDSEESHQDIILSNSASDSKSVSAQSGLLALIVLLSFIVLSNPAGLFSFHPSAQVASIVFLSEGILLLQPTSSANQKAKGLDLHQALQAAGLCSSLAGAAVIFYNKRLHGANHFTTWHGCFGLASYCVKTTFLLVLQASLGFIIGRQRGQAFIGINTAKSLWKWHRASVVQGYLVLLMLFTTPLLAILSSDWMTSHSTWVQRWMGATALVMSCAGVMLRANPKKMRLIPSLSKSSKT